MPRQTCYSPLELHRLRNPLPPRDPSPIPPEQRPVIGRESDPAATLAWAAHVAAGRIGVASPPPAPAPGGDYRLAGLDRILGIGPGATHRSAAR